jgi:ubiquinone/menaquinone biosynthesis C-methylase UbiE/predicted RNA-binding Zn-ribbon protein involved in translation (DUF1610 family)
MLLPLRETPDTWGREIVSGLSTEPLPPGTALEGPGSDPWDLVVFDRRQTSREELAAIGGRGPTLGLDEGGTARKYFSYLIDVFPRLPRDLPPNLFCEGFAAEGPGPASLRRPDKIHRVLLSFGGEDPAGLTETAYTAITASGLVEPENIDVVVGPLFTRPFERPCGRRIVGRTEIRSIISAYDAVFTSYGITPYEALKEGTAPILVNPTAYHEKLSRRAGFPSLGVRRIDAGFLAKLLQHPAKYLYPMVDSKKIEDRDLTGTIQGLNPEGNSVCPVCGLPRSPSVCRTLDKTYFACPSCGLVFLLNFSEGKTLYNRDYFFEEYRKQYGKTYIEDFGTIKKNSRGRLEIMERIGISLKDKNLLDVGCAYGPFIDAAREKGIRPQGLDVSPDAVRYVREHLKIPAAEGDFLTFQPQGPFGASEFDMVTLWYVIEHFQDLPGAMEKIAGLTHAGSILAFATPNRRGVTGLFFPALFYKQSPRDHFSLWDPKSARRVVSLYGFEIRKIRSTGHHPERFPLFFRKVLGFYLCGIISRLFGWGDTFEVYACKK